MSAVRSEGAARAAEIDLTEGASDVEDQPKQPLTGAPLILAIAVVVAWLAALVWLGTQTGATEIVWARLTFLLGSIEAVAFGAAGAIFGTQIQRQRVEAAERRAGKAEDDAKEEKQDAKNSRRVADEHRGAAEKGKALARAVKAEAQQTGPDRQRGARGSMDEERDQPHTVSLQLAEDLLSDA